MNKQVLARIKQPYFCALDVRLKINYHGHPGPNH